MENVEVVEPTQTDEENLVVDVGINESDDIELQEPVDPNMHQLDQNSVFLLQKFMMENAVVEKKLRDLSPLEESKFWTDDKLAYFADLKKPVMKANYHFIGEYQKISTNGDDKGSDSIFVFRWAWSSQEDLESLKAVKVMENSFDKLTVFNSQQISFQDDMLLNVLSAYSAEKMHLDYVCRFYDPNTKIFIIFGFTNLVWLDSQSVETTTETTTETSTEIIQLSDEKV